MLHGIDDRLLSMTWMSVAIAAVSTLVILFTPWPAGAAWPYIVAFGLVHIVYNVTFHGRTDATIWRRRIPSRAGPLAALTTGVTIALYTVIEGIGEWLSGGQAIAYTAWMFLFYWLMPMLFVAMRGFAALWTPVRAAPMAVGSSLVGGLVSIVAYGIVIWALQPGAMGAVSALRETSVVFAVLIERMFPRETVSGKRWLACRIVAGRAVCLGL